MVETRTVAKALLVHNDKILILKRSETDDRRPLQWDLPGGGVETNEDIKQGCAREIFEEASQIVRATQLHIVYSLTELIREGMSGSWIFMSAQVRSPDVNLSSEHVEARWVTLHEALKLFTYDRQLRALKYVLDNDLLHLSP